MDLKPIAGPSANNVVDEIIVDARALQDIHYRFRGVGQHSSSLLSALRTRNWISGRPRFTGLVSPELPHLIDDYHMLFDSVRSTTYSRFKANTVFLCLSPMTHDPLWLKHILCNPSIIKIALFYDLIQLQFPARYLAAGPERAEFAIRLSWLGAFNRLASISVASGSEATYRAGIPADQIISTGVAVRETLEPVKGQASLERAERTYYLIAGGGDPRKNPDAVIRAHARHTSQTNSTTSLHVLGSYPETMRHELRVVYSSEGGLAQQLTFLDHLTDEELRQEYRNAIVTIVPSYAEGFSVPIIESSAADTPCLVSDIPAHRELVAVDAARFIPDDIDQIQSLISRLETPHDDFWQSLRSAHHDCWSNFTHERVAERFASILHDAMTSRIAAPSVGRGARPKIGILTPVPPAASGVADFSAGMIKAVSRFVDVQLFTDTINPAEIKGAASLQPLPAIYSQIGSLDNLVSVIGNSHYHRGEFEFLLKRGGTVILHDARMINFYVILLGMDRAVNVARSECRREVEAHEVQGWLHNQENLPVLFLSEILEAASHAFVHSTVTAQLIERLYPVSPSVLPFAQYNNLAPRSISVKQKKAIRDRFGISSSAFLITTFGFVSPDKAPDEIIWATKMLRDWKVPAVLLFCGGFVTEELKQHLHRCVAELGMTDYVRFSDGVVDIASYKSLLFASEAAIQLRTYFMGGLSGALNDCIAAGLPCVANEHLAAAMDAPAFVRRVPDSLSPLLIAEALLDIIVTGQDRRRPLEEARVFAHSHSFDAYASSLVEGLGFSVTSGQPR